ncbi:hypothetical protein [Agromyces sp. ISL-38]|nr:hypothetical protein [Agromyces sp. ISL-38]
MAGVDHIWLNAAWKRRRRGGQLTGARIWVDDPRAFMDEVRKHL